MPRTSPRTSWLPPLWTIGVAGALLVMVTVGGYLAGRQWPAGAEAVDAQNAAAADAGPQSPSPTPDEEPTPTPSDDASSPEEDEADYPAGIDPESFYVLENVDTGTAIDVHNASTGNNTPVIVYDRHGQPNQQFRFEHVDDQYFEIVARHSEKVLQVGGVAGEEDSNQVTQLTSTGQANQHWAVEERGDGVVRLVNRATGQALRGENSGKPLEQTDGDDEPRQHWRLVDVA